MRDNSSAIALTAPPLSRTATGLWWGLLGVLAFSFTVPFTKIAVGGLSPLLIGAGRAAVAAVLAAVALGATRQRLPTARQWLRLGAVAGGVVVGFPFLTSYALTATEASHSAVVIAVLPAATAAATVLRTRERPPRRFWVAAAAGAAAAVAFAALSATLASRESALGNGDFGSLGWPDLFLFAAVIAAAIGYAEGGVLSRELGSWQTISWALVAAAPLTVPLAAWSVATDPPLASPAEWAAFAYLAAVSMFLGFFAWYRGLALGPMAQVSQTQLVQPVLTIAWSALLLAEPVTWPTLLGGLAVVAAAAFAVRSRLPR